MSINIVALNHLGPLKLNPKICICEKIKNFPLVTMGLETMSNI